MLAGQAQGSALGMVERSGMLVEFPKARRLVMMGGSKACI